jgi:DNA-binding transcriptional ArsR family regulator
MPKDPLQPARCAELLAALAAPERLNIVRLLTERACNVTEITKALKIKPLNVSHHLTVLKHAKLIRNKKQGRFVVYSLTEGVLEEMIEAGIPKEVLNLGCCQIVLPHTETPILPPCP